MPKRASLNVSPTAAPAAFVARKVGSDRYGSAGEVVRTGLLVREEKQPPDPAPPGACEQVEAATLGR
jgi:hypothetical protein